MAAKVVSGMVVSGKVTAKAAVHHHHHHVTEVTCAASIAATKVIRTETAAKKSCRGTRGLASCGKPGHISHDCKQPRAALLDGGADRQQSGHHFNLDGDAEARACHAEPPESPNFRGPRWKRGPPVTDPEGFQRVGGFRARVSFGDLPLNGPKTSQREQRAVRFSQYAHCPAIYMIVSEPAGVSSTVLAAPVGDFQPAGVIGGCVEPVVATEHHGSSAGLTALERAEAELDRRKWNEATRHTFKTFKN